MCGISGILRRRPDAAPPSADELDRTLDAMAHRGPDGRGTWASLTGDALLGHLRLAIIDLSAQGAQPMASADGRFHITYNGEIYNYKELRSALPDGGAALRTRSDTEVILALFAREGVRAFGRLRGMFGLAIWDEQARRLTLARDPLGIKPLYYASDAGAFRFASQVKALRAGGAIPTDLSPAGVVGFALWGSVPEPHTWLRAVRSVPAGCVLTVEGEAISAPQRYPRERPDGASSLESALCESVGAHLVADVPVGVFLSAGLDSTAIAILAQQAAAEPLRSFTVTVPGWRGTARDEGALAAATARALGLRHEERALERDAFRAAWHEHLAAMDQPSIDGFNTYLVSRLAREAGLKVVLSGLGGDELFGSYPSFTDVPRWQRQARALAFVPGARAAWPAMARALRPGTPKLAGLLDLGTSLAGAYVLRRGLFLPRELGDVLPRELVAEGVAEYDAVADAERALDGARGDAWRAVHALESALYLRNQLLRDSDWASLAHGLELRVPLVDAVLESQLAELGYEPGRSLGKAAALALAIPGLPAAVRRRRKSGFALPLEWLDDDHDLAARSPRYSSRGARAHAARVAQAFDLPWDRRVSVR
jgi:asparagine synthase (glutamine-hydrolysing)